MDTLVNDVLNYLFATLPISGKRLFIRLCKRTNTFKDNMSELELSFQKMIDDTGFITKRNYWRFYDPLSKYTIELLYDDYELPDCYVTVDNLVLCECEIVKICVTQKKLSVIEKISKLKICSRYVHYVVWWAASMGNIDILEWGYNSYKRKFASNITAAAIRGNQMGAFLWLVDKGYKVINETVECAAKYGSIDTIKFIITQYGGSCNIGHCVAQNQNPGVVEYVHSINPHLLRGIGDGAIKMSDSKLFKFAVDNGYVNESEKKMRGIRYMRCKSFKIFRWFFDHGSFFQDGVTHDAVATGNLKCLQFLCSKNSIVLDKTLFETAAKNYDIPMMKFLYELKSIRCFFTERFY